MARDVYIQAMRDGDHVLPHDPLLFAKQYRDMRRTIDDEISRRKSHDWCNSKQK